MMNCLEMISIIIPCYNEDEAIPIFYKKIDEVTRGFGEEFEFLFIDDGSSDRTLSTIKALRKSDKRVQYCSFSRNFGKEAAMYAGMEHVKGDYVAIMDVDLQDPPELLSEMFSLLKAENLDCVATKRSTRKGEPPIRSFFANLFYKLNNCISNVKIADGARDYRIMTRQMVDSILSLKERSRFSKGLFAWVGYDVKYIEYENTERVAGKTKWSFWKLLLYSIEGIISFSAAPLIFVSVLGFLACMISFLMLIYFVIQKLTIGIEINGYAAMMTIILFLGGVQLLAIGILGQYLAKIFIEAKDRPIYIVKEASETIGTVGREIIE